MKLIVVINLFILISLLFILFPMWMSLVVFIIGTLLLAGVWIDCYTLYRNDIRIDGGSIEDKE